jgi:hypothetical protein
LSPELGSPPHRRAELQQLITHAEEHQIQPYSGPERDPWLVLGDRIRILVRSLAGDLRNEPYLLDKGRAMAALAFTHGGDDAGASEMLADLEQHGDDHPFTRVFGQIVALDRLIDRDDWAASQQLEASLSQSLQTLGPKIRPPLMGRALGTLGRALMHRRALDQAVPVLQAAVSEHEAALAFEVPRSRVYLAMALRMAGHHEEALRQLDLAFAGFAAKETFSQPYLESCLMYWHYERARLLVETERPDEAVYHGREALAEAAWRGPWPKLGILRTLAWSERARGEEAAARGRIAEMETVSRAIGDVDTRRFAEGLIEEARGPFRRDGQVY